MPQNAFWFKKFSYIFQRKIGQTYENCQGVVGTTDDMQMFGDD